VVAVVTSWRPSPWSPTLNSGSVAAGAWPARASWKLVADALAGRASSRWSEVRALWLDGPAANDATLEVLAEAGCLDHLDELYLAGGGLSARGIALALGLPALTTLRLQAIAAADVTAVPASTVRTVALRGCDADTCAAVLAAAPMLTAAHLDSISSASDVVWNALAARPLTSLHLVHVPASAAALANALAGSGASLATLVLDDVAGVDSDEFLAGGGWDGLRTLRWDRGALARLGARLPPGLEVLKLRGSTIESGRIEVLPTRLTVLDVAGSSVSESIAERIGADPGGLVELGLGAGVAAARAVAAVAGRDGGPLRRLTLGTSPDRRSWRAGGVPPVAALPAGLEVLHVDRGWAVGDDLLRDLLRGDALPGLRELSLSGVPVGNPELGRSFAPRLRRLEMRGCSGQLDGVGASAGVALTRLVLDEVQVVQSELVELARQCQRLTSLHLERLSGLDSDGLSAVLAAVGEHLVQLELRGFAVDERYGDAVLASRYPYLAEVHLDEEMFSERGFHHLIAAEVTPALERLSVAAAMGEGPWDDIASRVPSSLHWIHGYTAGAADAVDERLRVAGAALHVRSM
jgi:hypothetical protein